MSLQKKINDEMDQLAVKIIRRAHATTDRAFIKKMCEAWFDLKRLLEMANSTVEIDTKTSMRADKNVESEQV